MRDLQTVKTFALQVLRSARRARKESQKSETGRLSVAYWDGYISAHRGILLTAYGFSEARRRVVMREVAK